MNIQKLYKNRLGQLICFCSDELKIVWFTKSTDMKPHDPLAKRRRPFFSISRL